MNPRILVIEDSKFLCYLLRKHLSELNMEVVGETARPREGLTLFDELKPDITIVDYSLPTMNGLQLVEAILSKDMYAYIVFLLPVRLREKSRELIGMGLKGVLLKPFHVEQLQSLLIEVTVNL